MKQKTALFREAAVFYFILLLSFSCGVLTAQTPRLTFNEEYVPHHVNDFWEYTSTGAGSNFSFTVEVIGNGNLEGHNALVFEKKIPSLHVTSHHYYAFTSSARTYYGSEIPAENSFIKNIGGIVLPLSPRFPQGGVFSQAYHQSNVADHTYDDCHYTYRLNGTDRFWFGSGGTVYDVIKIDYSDAVTDAGKDYNVMESPIVTEYYAKGIGLVKSESHDRRTGRLIQTVTLVRAKINGHMFQ